MQRFAQRSLGWPENLPLDLKSFEGDHLKLHGGLRGSFVEVTRRPEGAAYRWTIEVRNPSVPTDLGIRVTGAGDRLLDLIGRGDFAVGDPDFDAEHRLDGSTAALMAALTQQTRSRLAAWIARGLVIADGRLCWSGRGAKRSREAARTLAALLDLARDLRVGAGSLRRKLLRNVGSDDLPNVRLNNLAQLLDPALGVTGRQLAEALKSLTSVSDGAAARVFADARRYQAEHHPSHFGRVPESALIAMLAFEDAHRLAALPALANRGTTAALPFIVALTSGLFAKATVKAAARAAAGAILARNGGEAGALAIVDDAEGGLTFAD